jgi:hypothetical protein
MKAAIFKGPGEIAIGERPDPVIKDSTDAVVRVVLACVCGSDLWYYRGETDFPADSPIGRVAIRLQRRNMPRLPGRNDYGLRTRRLHPRR